jgi:hypothetical protein
MPQTCIVGVACVCCCLTGTANNSSTVSHAWLRRRRSSFAACHQLQCNCSMRCTLTVKAAQGNIQGHHGRLEPAPTLDGHLQVPAVCACVLNRTPPARTVELIQRLTADRSAGGKQQQQQQQQHKGEKHSTCHCTIQGSVLCWGSVACAWHLL